jgi:transposase InsO family protein
MRIGARYDLARELSQAYWLGSRAQKGALLDHFCGVTGYHRKYALTLLRGRRRVRSRRRRKAVYDERVRAALRVAWEACGYICAERLRGYLPELISSLVCHRALVVDEETRAKLERISTATLKRLMRQLRTQIRGRRLSTTRPGTLLRRDIPVELSAYEHNVPGYLEIDLVAHCGQSGAGHFINTLCATDLATGWTERIAISGKSREAVVAAIAAMNAVLPFPLLGIHSDNGSEFINELLLKWCRAQNVGFTRGRPYRKNDNAHVEQKNWTLVRKLIGYDRLDSQEQLVWLNALYNQLLRPYNNLFQPVMKLVAKERIDGRLRKRYDVARTPLDRIIAAGIETSYTKHLQAQRLATNPLALKRRIDRTLAAMPAALEVQQSA